MLQRRPSSPRRTIGFASDVARRQAKTPIAATSPSRDGPTRDFRSLRRGKRSTSGPSRRGCGDIYDERNVREIASDPHLAGTMMSDLAEGGFRPAHLSLKRCSVWPEVERERFGRGARKKHLDLVALVFIGHDRTLLGVFHLHFVRVNGHCMDNYRIVLFVIFNDRKRLVTFEKMIRCSASKGIAHI